MTPAALPPKLVGAELELTTRCGCRCATCGSSAGAARPGELTVAQWIEVVDDLANLGCRQLTLLGGEPLALVGWSRLARHAVNRGLSVELVTSGVDVDAEVARQANEAGLCSVTVSVDGTEAVHDRQRGKPGCYRQALQAIRLLDGAGLCVGVNSQLNRETLGTLEALAPQLQAAGALGWQVQLTMPLGRAARSALPLGPNDMPQVRAALARLARRRGLRPSIADNVGYFTPDDPRLRTRPGGLPGCWLGCMAGLRHVGITSDGGVKGCLTLPDTYAEGSVHHESLARIWSDPNRFRYTRRFSPSGLGGDCAACPYGTLCRGGCTAAAVAFHGVPHINTHCLRLHSSS